MVAYEILLMLDPELPQERQEEIVARARELVERDGGAWVGQDVWGRRKLAYEIDHKGEGVYHLLSFDTNAETLDELSRILRITDGVMRHMPTRRLAGPASAPPPPEPQPEPQAETESQPAPESVSEPGYAEANGRSPEEE